MNKEHDSQEPMTVLVADDNRDYQSLLKYLLERQSYRVVAAMDGRQALKLAVEKHPHLMLVDYNMPQLNGYELIRELKSRPETSKIPIIMFTGYTHRRHLRDVTSMDVVDFLEKPIPNQTILDAVAKVLGTPAQPHEPTAAGNDSIGRVQDSHRSGQASEVPPLPPQQSVRPPASPDPLRHQSNASETAGPQMAGAVMEPPSDQVPEPEAPEPASAESIEPQAPAFPMEPDFLPDDDQAILQLVETRKEQQKAQEAHEALQLEALSSASPIIKVVNQILIRAVDMKASDIHVEPQEKELVVRVRLDGSLQVLRTFPPALHAQLAARIKIMADLSITERRLPQDGRFNVVMRDRKIEFRVSTLPCVYGEKIVMRILGQSKLKGKVRDLGLNGRDQAAIEQAAGSPHGLILVTGPTGSGKTTTLYTVLAHLNNTDVNIMTVEDPVEYQLPGISQVQINPHIHLTFESVLRSFLRQDPDIMLVGEIRDLETAEIAVKASVTGHLVLSTLHTNSAAAAVTRLTHMGLAPFLLAASLRMVMAQRLLRRLCPHCKKASELGGDDRKFLSGDEPDRLKQVYVATGCNRCHKTGFSGRFPVFEVMPVSSGAMREAILTSAGLDKVTKLAVREGMTTLRSAALAAVGEGLTSMDEALDIILGE
ncbi:MAG: Flp pilus assembly complex ATPase component TadA [Elusimicrobia bacterium]|nr:Flp pilus assembly complex ATPase component TadA [Elusimicrobiota bacterium]